MSSQSRHVYSPAERTTLEASFASRPHPNVEEKERLAKLLNCNLIQISNWFQNRRRRMKKHSQSKRGNSSLTVKQDFAPCSHYETGFACYQPNGSYSNYDDNCPYFHYLSSAEYTYCHEPLYTQPMFFNHNVVYRTER